MAGVVRAFNGSVFNRAVHAFDLPVRSRLVWLGQLMLDAICCGDHVDPYGPGIGGTPVAGLLKELNPIVRQFCVDIVGHHLQYSL